jgi:excisionase family DNA binding protein
MSKAPEMLTVKRAAEELGLSPVSIRRAVMRGALEVVPLDGRTYLVSREEVERYRRDHLGQRGKRLFRRRPRARRCVRRAQRWSLRHSRVSTIRKSSGWNRRLRLGTRHIRTRRRTVSASAA